MDCSLDGPFPGWTVPRMDLFLGGPAPWFPLLDWMDIVLLLGLLVLSKAILGEGVNWMDRAEDVGLGENLLIRVGKKPGQKQ